MLKRKEVFIISIIILVLLLTAFTYINNNKSYVKINGKYIDVEIADSPEERIRGLMYRDFLTENSGMLFIFDNSDILEFWMKNTLISLDIIYIDENMKIVKIIENVQPCLEDPCESYSSSFPAKYVLEVNAGEADKLGIKEGDFVQVVVK